MDGRCKRSKQAAHSAPVSQQGFLCSEATFWHQNAAISAQNLVLQSIRSSFSDYIQADTDSTVDARGTDQNRGPGAQASGWLAADQSHRRRQAHAGAIQNGVKASRIAAVWVGHCAACAMLTSHAGSRKPAPVWDQRKLSNQLDWEHNRSRQSKFPQNPDFPCTMMQGICPARDKKHPTLRDLAHTEDRNHGPLSPNSLHFSLKVGKISGVPTKSSAETGSCPLRPPPIFSTT